MRYAVVTGSAKGIGKAIAIKLLTEGFCVFINYTKDDEGVGCFVAEAENIPETIKLSSVSDPLMKGWFVLPQKLKRW